jgi:hypothetical protein
VETARELLERFDPQAPVRLVGVGLAGLEGESEETNGPARDALPQEDAPAGASEVDQLHLAG